MRNIYTEFLFSHSKNIFYEFITLEIGFLKIDFTSGIRYESKI